MRIALVCALVTQPMHFCTVFDCVDNGGFVLIQQAHLRRNIDALLLSQHQELTLLVPIVQVCHIVVDVGAFLQAIETD